MNLGAALEKPNTRRLMYQGFYRAWTLPKACTETEGVAYALCVVWGPLNIELRTRPESDQGPRCRQQTEAVL
jgi:hypothetical protein